MSCQRRGDTIIEVMLAFSVFALIAVSSTYLMNRSLSVGQRSLETTLVRQQIDTQAELLRYVRDTGGHPVWDQIKDVAKTTTAPDSVSLSSCPTAHTESSGAFVLYLVDTPSGGEVRLQQLNTASSYELASYYSRVNLDTGQSEGLWVTPVAVEGIDNTYDMYIQACWDSVGYSQPQNLSTIVRLYET